MAIFLIAGSFRIVGAQPDGDSIRFTPTDPAQWDLITGPNKVKRNASGAAQLRMDAIDTLETHYGSPRTHQPLELAHAAAAELLDWLGFTNVVRGQDETVTSSTPDTVEGFILTLDADLVDTLHVEVSPEVELGAGSRLCESPEELLDRFHLEVVPSPSGVTHHLFWRR